MTTDWTFKSEAVVQSFDTHVNAHLPGYVFFQRLVIQIAEWFVPQGGTVVDVGASTGTTAAALVDAYPQRDMTFWLYDESEAMCREAWSKLSPIDAGLHIVHGQAENSLRHDNADLSLSLFTLQFMRPNARRKLLQGLHEAAAPGSCLLVGEKIRPDNARWAEYATSLTGDYKHAAGVDADKARLKEKQLRGVLMPFTDAENRSLITGAGWNEVEVMYRWQNWVLYGALA